MDDLDYGDVEDVTFIGNVRKSLDHQRTRQKRIKKLLVAIGIAGYNSLVLVAAIAVLLGIIIIAVVFNKPNPTQQPEVQVLKDLSDYMLSAMDKSADPCQDFYQYACGAWIDRVKEGVAEGSDFERAFSTVFNSIQTQLQTVMSKRPDPLLNQLYDQCMEGAIDATTITDYLQSISTVKDTRSLMAILAAFHDHGFGGFFDIEVEPDAKNPDVYMLYIVQGGLFLPSRDFYLDQDSFSIQLRNGYQRYMAEYLQRFLGEPQSVAAQHAAALMDFEIQIARIWIAQSEMNPNNTYNKISWLQLQELTPELPWSVYFSQRKAPSFTELILDSPTFIPELNALINKTDWSVIQDYLVWNFAVGVSGLLPDNRDLHARFQSFLKGRKQQQQDDSSEACVGLVDSLLGNLLGKYYVETFVDSESKSSAEELITDVKNAFMTNLNSVWWMNNITKIRTVEKLNAIRSQVLYPNKWDNFTELTLDDNILDSSLKIVNFLQSQQLSLIGAPVDKDMWYMTPQTVNAYYSPQGNEIVIPAGILQSPFYNASYPSWANFGGITYVLGHEITHGGMMVRVNGVLEVSEKVLGKGMLRDWWSEEMVTRFNTQAKCVVDCYDKYEVEPGLYIRGNVTEGENIADLGGIRLAYVGYKAHLKEYGEKFSPEEFERYFPGFSNDQLFFISFAQLWCDAASDVYQQMLTRSNEHSPSKFRVLGALSNFETFAQTFNCPAGSPMNPSDQCRVW